MAGIRLKYQGKYLKYRVVDTFGDNVDLLHVEEACSPALAN
jgi:hypothetical protein